jgi:hypothetical protein
LFVDLHHRGQPSVWSDKLGSKHIVFESFWADGTCLPPVIFSTEEVNKDDIDKSLGKSFIHYTPDVKAPSEYTTQV